MCVYNIGATVHIRSNNLLTSTKSLSNIHAGNYKCVLDIYICGSNPKHKSNIYVCLDLRVTVNTNTQNIDFVRTLDHYLNSTNTRINNKQYSDLRIIYIK